MGKSTELGMPICSQKTKFIPVNERGRHQMAGKKAPMWKKVMNDVDLDEPTSFLDQEYLGCAQRECVPNEDIVEQYKNMFESRISGGVTEYYQGGTNITQKRQQGPMTWKDMLRSAWKDVENWETKRQSNYTKFQVLAWMTIMSKRRSSNQLENCEKYAHRWY